MSRLRSPLCRSGFEQADRLANDHAEQIVRQIQACATADTRTNAHIAI
jgi:hypothetical protein